ncbi:MAG: tetratricopeptide repeat-containing sulfotransferase family protein [Erythrobacter sp.]
MDKPDILKAIDSLNAHDRASAVRHIMAELRKAPPDSKRYNAIARLAQEVGELDLAIEATRRQARHNPIDGASQLAYLGQLAQAGRTQAALEALAKLPASMKADPALRHFHATLHSEMGDFDAAVRAYRDVLDDDPRVLQSWFALTMLKTFSPGDPDLAQMEAALPVAMAAEPVLRARFLYGLGKAWADIGDLDRSFGYYHQGAALMRAALPYQAEALAQRVDAIIAGFTLQAMQTLRPSHEPSSRPIFVTGLPRSGTTLVEQILATHSQVSDGAETNLFKAAAIPANFDGIAGARAFERRFAAHPDPWGDMARDYLRMLDMRFGGQGRVVDKTLVQSQLLGLILHALPNARVIWLRRRPEDCALSAFRSFFTAPIAWSWSFADIGHFFRLEDRLFAHWTKVHPDKILVVHYEELVSRPEEWIARILDHVGLPHEAGLEQFHLTRRSVRTASVRQVREPISTGRIGAADRYAPYMTDFHSAYYGR